jgi:osmotically-inducible protein OsmY
MKYRFQKLTGIQILALVFSLLLLVIQSACASGPAKPDDEKIGFWVRQALTDDPRVLSSDVAVSVDSGIVTLDGSVRNLVERNFAEKETMKIDGVRGVINKLEVNSVRRPDEELARIVKERIVNCMALTPENLKVQSLEGTVTLKGDVPSWNDFREAALLASETAGVRAVTNRLMVTYPAKRPDREIRMDVSEALGRDVYLSGLPVDVKVQDGVVTLTGIVDNGYEKQRATEDTDAVWNVKSVDNELKMVPHENDGVRKNPALPDDADLKKAVRDELVQDLRISDPYSITTYAEDGHVTLKGLVRNNAQKRLAIEDAKNVVGVGWVTNDLVVKSTTSDDLTTQKNVRSALDFDYALFGDKIEAFVENGVVTLSGTVDTYYEKDHAAQVASRIAGVVDTRNHLEVRSCDTYSDTTLRKRIENRLAGSWETKSVAKSIHVQVKNGRATLTGSVDSWGERREADRLACFTAGIRAVDNRLKVRDVDYRWDEWPTTMPTTP